MDHGELSGDAALVFESIMKQKISSIPGTRNKLLYIWDYYKLWIIGFLALAAAAVYFLAQSSMVHREHWFYLALANTFEDVGTDSRLCRDYAAYTGYDLKEKDIVFNNQLYFDFTLNTTGNTYFETFIVYAEAGTLDAITMETDSLVALGQTGRLMDLNAPEAAGIREKYQDRFLYYEGTDADGNAVSYPVGIDLSDSLLMTQYHVYGNSCALGIGYQTKHPEAVELFLDYVLEQ